VLQENFIVSNYYGFSMYASGPGPLLQTLRRFLQPAVGMETDIPGKRVFHVDRLFPDLDEKCEHKFIWLHDFDDGLLPIEPSAYPIDDKLRKRYQRGFDAALKLGIEEWEIERCFRHVERPTEQWWGWREYEKADADQRKRMEMPRLKAQGNTTHGPPSPLALRLSKMFPIVEFNIRASYAEYYIHDRYFEGEANVITEAYYDCESSEYCYDVIDGVRAKPHDMAAHGFRE